MSAFGQKHTPRGATQSASIHTMGCRGTQVNSFLWLYEPCEQTILGAKREYCCSSGPWFAKPVLLSRTWDDPHWSLILHAPTIVFF